MKPSSAERIRQSFDRDYFTADDLRFVFGDGPALHNQTKRMVAAGALVSLKRGHYVLGEEYRKSIDLFEIANWLRTPSYVSLKSALAAYDLIPDRVVSITSVTSGAPYQLETPLSTFVYRKIPTAAFLAGVKRVEGTHFATKEKALLDTIYLDCKDKNAIAFVLQGLRIEVEDLAELSANEILTLVPKYSNKTFERRVEPLLQYLGD